MIDSQIASHVAQKSPPFYLPTCVPSVEPHPLCDSVAPYNVLGRAHRRAARHSDDFALRARHPGARSARDGIDATRHNSQTNLLCVRMIATSGSSSSSSESSSKQATRLGLCVHRGAQP